MHELQTNQTLGLAKLLAHTDGCGCGCGDEDVSRGHLVSLLLLLTQRPGYNCGDLAKTMTLYKTAAVVDVVATETPCSMPKLKS
ncbi:hypothetical protein ACLKA6_019972 [Drosophila palustris]